MRIAILALVLLVGGCGAAGSAPAPTLADSSKRASRIVSINPCIDAVLMRVADAAQIVAISHYSQDPRATSIPMAVARRFRATSGTAEEILALRPDLVLLSGALPPATAAALARLHVRTLELPLPQSLAESEAQVRTIANAVGQPERGAVLAGRIAKAVRRAQPPQGAPVPALIWQGGGLVPAGGTLPDEMLRAAGFVNLGAAYGLKNWDILPMEYLVAKPPHVLLTARHSGRDDRLLGHPVMRRLRDRIAVRDFPERLLFCGGPTIIDVMDRLSAVRRSL